eukprot:CAMPEP_0185831440 /NCGR_PEP_ID=MMETSP1353-20130828/1489_1 /TAXON_ID=1077150 /ORGANISM="Erythrolobus australicus, Strain CCMP3124" /LENGTH=198 /DNA_ID=CAMNT_0028529497 /DNA_START=184 /DNA_END=780 /DNA_ORIENTATION=+
MYVLARLIAVYAARGASAETAAAVWDEVAPALKVWQTGAVLEVLHALVGFVRSPVSSTLLQVTSRVYVLWLVAAAVPEARASPVFSSMIVAWCLAEIPRYLWYGISLVSKPPFALTWIRYSGFLLLYPVGAGSEIVITAISLPYQRALQPAPWRYVLCIAALIVYVPGLPYMYYYMMRQRRRQLRGSTISKTAASKLQ